MARSLEKHIERLEKKQFDKQPQKICYAKKKRKVAKPSLEFDEELGVELNKLVSILKNEIESGYIHNLSELGNRKSELSKELSCNMPKNKTLFKYIQQKYKAKLDKNQQEEERRIQRVKIIKENMMKCNKCGFEAYYKTIRCPICDFPIYGEKMNTKIEKALPKKEVNSVFDYDFAARQVIRVLKRKIRKGHIADREGYKHEKEKMANEQRCKIPKDEIVFKGLPKNLVEKLK